MIKDVISSIFLLCLGLFYLILSLKYHAGDLANPQPGFLPRIVGLVIVSFSLMLLISSLRDQKKKEKLNSLWQGLDRKNCLSAMMAIGSIIVYLLIVNYVGFPLASAALVWFLGWMMGGTNQILIIILGIVSSGLTYWLFWIIMRVPIPLGSLWGG